MIIARWGLWVTAVSLSGSAEQKD